MQLVTRLITLSYLLILVLGYDGFYKLDLNVLKGPTLSSALHRFLEGLENHTSKMGYSNNTYSATLTNERAFYVSKLSIGNPAVDVSVLLDTGSSDLWVMSSKNPHCKNNGGNIACDQYGTFNESASSTFHDNGTAFSIQYMDNSYATGIWGTDDILLTGGLKLDNASFAIANDSDSIVGVLGIAYESLESTKQYTNLPALMKQQGFIKKIAYSLYLTSQEADTGSILFGGIDHAKFSGDLAVIDIAKNNNEYIYLQIPLSSISAHLTTNKSEDLASIVSTASNGSLNGSTAAHNSNPSSSESIRDNSNPIDTNNVPALLDSGTTLSYLSESMLQKVVCQVDSGAEYNSNVGGYIVPCSLRQKGNYLTFNFNNEKGINVPLSDLVLEAGQNTKTGEIICMLGILPSNEVILGNNFLRSCYSVFNLDDKTISIAQMKYTNDEKIKVIE